MVTQEDYSRQFKNEIIRRYQQSGLTVYQFCQLTDVPVSAVTVKRWLRMFGENTHHTNNAIEPPSPHMNLNIACYSLSNNVERFVDEEEEAALTLEEMIKFQQDVHNCCIKLYQKSCSKKNVSLLSQIMEVL